MMTVLSIFQRNGANRAACAGAGIDFSGRIEDARYIVLDSELTGLEVKHDSIVSLGAIRMAGPRIILGKTFDRLVSPETKLRRESVLIHGITPSEVEGKPGIDTVLDELMAFCTGSLLVGHFISLDLAFLNRELKRLRGRELDIPAIDTWRIHTWLQYHRDTAARHFGENGDKDLFSLARKYNVPIAKAHDALGDAFITAQLFQRFLSLLPELGVRTVKDLLGVGKP